MATQDALQTMGMSGDAAAQRQAQVNDTNDISLTPAKAGAQLDKGPSANEPKLTSALPTPKRRGFSAPSKEDPKLLAKMSDSKNDVAGQINGTPAFIDGYLRIQKRRYGSRGQYGVISKGYKI